MRNLILIVFVFLIITSRYRSLKKIMKNKITNFIKTFVFGVKLKVIIKYRILV